MNHDDDIPKGRGQAADQVAETRADYGRHPLSDAALTSALPPASWLQKLHAFCEQHREQLEELPELFGDAAPGIEGDCLAFELIVRSPHQRFFAQIHHHLSQLALKLSHSSRVSLDVSVIGHHPENRIRAVFTITEPDQILLLRLDNLFRRYLREFRFQPPAGPPSPNSARLPASLGVAEQTHVYFSGTVPQERPANGNHLAVETSVVIFPTEGSAALQPVYKALEYQQQLPEVSPSSAAIPAQLPDKNLTESESTGKKRSANHLSIVSKEIGSSPALTGPEARAAKLRTEIDALDTTLAQLQHSLRQQFISQLEACVPVLESIRSQKQAELRRVLDQIPEEPKELPAEIVEALRTWPVERRTPPEGGRPENPEAFVSRIFKEYYQQEGGYDPARHPQLRAVDLVNQDINPTLYSALMSHNSRHGITAKPILLRKSSEQIDKEIKAADKEGYGDLSHREAERLKRAKYRRSKKAASHISSSASH